MADACLVSISFRDVATAHCRRVRPIPFRNTLSGRVLLSKQKDVSGWMATCGRQALTRRRQPPERHGRCAAVGTNGARRSPSTPEPATEMFLRGCLGEVHSKTWSPGFMPAVASNPFGPSHVAGRSTYVWRPPRPSSPRTHVSACHTVSAMHSTRRWMSTDKDTALRSSGTAVSGVLRLSLSSPMVAGLQSQATMGSGKRRFRCLSSHLTAV